MKRFLFSLVAFAFAVPGFLSAQTVSPKNFDEISRQFNAHYDSAGKNASGYKQFKRWEWYYSTRLSKEGNLTNNFALNQQALEYTESKMPTRDLVPQSSTGAWSFLGPASVNSGDRGIGRANRMAFHPTNPNKLYVASATGGLWITENGGLSWIPQTDGISNLSLSGVAVNYNNPDIMYILTGDADSQGGSAAGQFGYAKTSIGVLKTLDGGLTWRKTGLQFEEIDGVLAYNLVMHPTNPDILLVATNLGICRSTNAGSTWAWVITTGDFYDMEFQPGSPNTIYACGNTGISTFDSVIVVKSVDGGATFTRTFGVRQQENGNQDWVRNRSELAVTPANSNYVYLLVGPATGDGTFHGLYRSTNAGSSFSLRNNMPNIMGGEPDGADDGDQQEYNMALSVSPTNENILGCGGINLWTSSNGGTSFQFQQRVVSSLDYYHADIHQLIYHPLNSGILYMCGDGGVYRSSNNGDTWTGLNNSLGITQYYKISINQGIGLDQNILIGGAQDNGTNKRNSGGGGTFQQIKGADGMDCFIDPDYLNHYVVSIQNGEFHFSSNAGNNFEFVCDAEEATTKANTFLDLKSFWVTPVAEIAGSAQEFIIGYTALIKVSRTGSSLYAFEQISPNELQRGKVFVKTARGNASRIYYGDRIRSSGENWVWTSTNGGTSFSLILKDTLQPPMTDMAFATNNGNRVWVTYGGYDATRKVMFTANGGANWVNITGSLPNVPVNCIVYETNSTDDGVYVGTDIGVFYRNNTLGNWIPFSNGLPVVEVTDLEIHTLGFKLRAGTYGRGIWETNLYNTCLSNLNLNTSNTDINAPYYFQAGQTISSSAVHGGDGANVFYTAGSNVMLNIGFRAFGISTNNVIDISTGPCGAGVPSAANGITTLNRGKGVLIE